MKTSTVDEAKLDNLLSQVAIVLRNPDKITMETALDLREAYEQIRSTRIGTVSHDGIPAHDCTRIYQIERQTTFTYCARCGYWYEPVPRPSAS